MPPADGDAEAMRERAAALADYEAVRDRAAEADYLKGAEDGEPDYSLVFAGHAAAMEMLAAAIRALSLPKDQAPRQGDRR